MTPATRGELDGLLSALCDDRLTGAKHERLGHLLDADVECRRHYLQYVDIHARLLVHPRYGAVARAVGPARPRPAGRGWRYLVVAATTLAASLLVQIAWLHPRPPEGGAPAVAAAVPTTPRYVATLT